ncbi:MAG: PAS domain S-box protein [Magnetococcales bacterium]|nr:PAS domain S-box protein [Magnetococcales bacterium]
MAVRKKTAKPPAKTPAGATPPATAEAAGDAADAAPIPGKRKRAKDPKKKNLFLVGIGASAGGLEALRPLVTKLPANTSIGYVVVQHMAPQYRSMMAELLSREAKLPVVEIKHNTEAQANTIYITPPNHDVDIRDGVLFLKPPTNPVGPKPSIDNFFSALAEDMGERAIGVVLSGTGSDGALGMRAIKAHGGFTVVQDPETAKYNGMPLASIETNLIDLILSPDKIGLNLPEIVQTPGKILELMDDEKPGPSGLDEIYLMVRKRTDIDFSKYKQTTLCRRIERRIKATSTHDLPDYVDFMRANPGEAESLAKDILIAVTSFFRDPDAFKTLNKIMDDIVRKKEAGDEIRIWTPGCSTGEEPYSVAIMLSERLGIKMGNFKIQIFATDIDLEALEAARKGVYLESGLRDMPPGLIERYFSKKGDKFHVSKELRDLVVFARQDLARDPPFVRVDLISCRNVLIYFNQELQDRIFSAFHFALASNGYLFLGKSESLGQNSEMFTVISSKHRVFQKKVGVGDRFGRVSPFEKTKSSWQCQGAQGHKKISIEEAMRSTIMRVYAPKSILVGDDGSVFQINGDVTGYMVLGTGKGDLNVTRMLIPELRGEFWALFSQVKKTGESAVGAVKLVNFNEKLRKGVRMGIHPASQVASSSSLYLIGFEEFEIPEPLDPALESPITEPASSRLPELEQELTATKEHLQTVIEELETSNEELQALNEELQASNEEMQSTNEELETANEELQSTNEELTTVNEELQTRTSQLMVANADLENMQKNVGYSIVIVDPKLRVKRFSPAAVKYFGLALEDIGESITSTPSHLEVKNLRRKISQVISSGKVHQEEILTDKLSLWFRIVPYHSMENKVEGAVLVIIDQSEIYSIRQELARNERLQRLVSDSLPMGVALVDREQRILNANRKFEEWFGQDKTLPGKKLSGILGLDLLQCLKPGLEKVLDGTNSVMEMDLALPNLGERTFRILMETRDNDQKEAPDAFLLIFDDMTELTAARKELHASRERYRTLAESGLQGVVIHHDGLPVYANHQLARIFGYATPEEVIVLKNLEPLLPPEEVAGGASQSRLFGSGHAPSTHSARGLRKDGRLVELLVSSRVVDWDGSLSIQTVVVDLNSVNKE